MKSEDLKIGSILRLVGLLALCAALVCALAGCGGGSSEQPKKVGEVAEEEKEPEPTEQPQDEPETFGVGDKVQLGDIIITLTAVTENNGNDFTKPADGKVFAVCDFEVENSSDKDVNITTMMGVESYVDDYATGMNLSAVMCDGKQQLGGTLAPGKKMVGSMGYELDQDWKELEIHYTPDFWSDGEIVFVYSK